METAEVLRQIEEDISFEIKGDPHDTNFSITEEKTKSIVKQYTEKLKQISNIHNFEELNEEFHKMAKLFAREYVQHLNDLVETHDKQMQDDYKNNWKEHAENLKKMRASHPRIGTINYG